VNREEPKLTTVLGVPSVTAAFNTNPAPSSQYTKSESAAMQ
jgi:hypothetical protein